MRKVKVDKETYLVLRALKVEEGRQIPDILREAVGNYQKSRERRLKRLAKKLLGAKKEPEKKPEAPTGGEPGPEGKEGLQPDPDAKKEE